MDDLTIGTEGVVDTDTEATSLPSSETDSNRCETEHREHSVYDVSANAKLTRAAKAKVRAEAAAEIALLNGDEYDRPTVRADCLPGGMNEARPCPFVGCKYHLYLEVSKETGSLQVNFPGLEPWELSESCALDIVDRDQGITLEKVGELLQRTRERVRQIETAGLEKVRRQLKVLTE